MILFLKILIAHIITDFFLQPNSWVVDKKIKKERSKYLYAHILLTALVAWAALGFSQLDVVLIIALTHLIIDWYKLSFLSDDLKSFLFDQLLHILVLISCAVYVHDLDFDWNAVEASVLNAKNLAIAAGYMIVTVPSGYLVGKATQKWRKELAASEEERDNLKDAGIWIGILERILVLTFVLMNVYQAIGFLIAAKSILRFSDKNETKPRMQTEYVLIGTLISFSIAIGAGIFIELV